MLNDLAEFKRRSEDILSDVEEKVYTRNLYRRD